MSPNNPFGWDLPPGVTPKMIDEAMGGDTPECPKCDGPMEDPGDGAWVCMVETPCGECKAQGGCQVCDGDGFTLCDGQIMYEPDPDDLYEAQRDREREDEG